MLWIIRETLLNTDITKYQETHISACFHLCTWLNVGKLKFDLSLSKISDTFFSYKYENRKQNNVLNVNVKMEGNDDILISFVKYYGSISNESSVTPADLCCTKLCYTQCHFFRQAFLDHFV